MPLGLEYVRAPALESDLFDFWFTQYRMTHLVGAQHTSAALGEQPGYQTLATGHAANDPDDRRPARRASGFGRTAHFLGFPANGSSGELTATVHSLPNWSPF